MYVETMFFPIYCVTVVVFFFKNFLSNDPCLPNQRAKQCMEKELRKTMFFIFYYNVELSEKLLC